MKATSADIKWEISSASFCYEGSLISELKVEFVIQLYERRKI